MKNQHLILYWNLHQAPLKGVIFLIVAILLAIQWCWQIFACANSMEIFQQKSSVISQKGKSQNWCFIKTKHVKLSKKQTFLTPWYASGGKSSSFSENLACFVFLKHPFWNWPFWLIADEINDDYDFDKEDANDGDSDDDYEDDWIVAWDHLFSASIKVSRKSKSSYPLIHILRYVYQRVRNITLTETFGYVLNEWSFI